MLEKELDYVGGNNRKDSIILSKLNLQLDCVSIQAYSEDFSEIDLYGVFLAVDKAINHHALNWAVSTISLKMMSSMFFLKLGYRPVIQVDIKDLTYEALQEENPFLLRLKNE